MTLQLFIVDAFTDAPFAGNPAAVVILDGPRSDAWMQSVAAEMNLSETAFLHPDDGSGIRWLRWFTPLTEVALCGHATLATAHVLGGDQRFTTLSGELRCVATANGWIEMDFPADPASPADDLRDQVLGALPGVVALEVARGAFDVLVEVGSEEEVRRTVPDMGLLARIAVRGVIVTAPADGGSADFVSRGFFPAAGIPEDPVTGSAHCTLASWWAPKLGRSDLVGDQLSRRGGRVRVSLRGDRVVLSGTAVTLVEGALRA